MSNEQTKCICCGRRFGEMDDEPVECENCGFLTCPDCPCCDDDDDDDEQE